MEQQNIQKKKRNIRISIMNKNLFLLWQGQLITSLGYSIYELVLGFWVLQETGSTSLMGIVMAVSMIPRIFLSPLAGSFADRFERRMVMVSTDFIRGLSIIILGLTIMFGKTHVWVIVLCSVINGICSSFFNPAVQSVLPDITDKENLLKVNSLFTFSTTGIETIGKSVGGFLYQIISTPFLFIMYGICYILSAISELFIKIPQKVRNDEKINIIEDLKEGFLYIKNFKGLTCLYTTIAFLNFFGVMASTLILPYFNSNALLGPERYGIAMGLSTAGTTFGYVLLSIFNLKKVNNFNLFLLSGLGSTFCLFFFLFVKNYPMIIALLTLEGFLSAIMNSIVQTCMQITVSANVRGKVFGFKNTLTASLIPVAITLGGVLAEFIPVGVIISTCCCIVFLLILRLGFVNSVKQLMNGMN